MKKLQPSLRLIVFFAAILAMIGTLTYQGFRGNHRAVRLTENISGPEFQRTTHLIRTQGILLSILAAEQEKASVGSLKVLTPRVNKYFSDLSDEVREWTKVSNHDDMELLERLNDFVGHWNDAYSRQSDGGDVHVFSPADADEASKLAEALNSYADYQKNAMEQSTRFALASYGHSRNRWLWLGLVFSALTLFFLLELIRQQSMHHQDLRKIVKSLSKNSSEITSASTEIAGASERLFRGTSDQAAALQQTASSMQQINAMANKNADSALKTSERANVSHETAMKGKSVVEEMLRAMEDINESNNGIMRQMKESHQKFAEIVKVILEISDKSKVINDIAFQTKLLSFNASVEAARAGEHGNGFAVVAQEVGNLAQMSGNASKEIALLLKGSTERVEVIVQETTTAVERLLADGNSKTELGTKVAEECHQVLEQIVQDVSQVSQRAREIVTASTEQSRGVGEISRAIGQLDAVTQENVLTSQRSARAADGLSAQAESLKSAMKSLLKAIRSSDDAESWSGGFASGGSSRGGGNFHRETATTRTIRAPKGTGFESPSENDPRFREAS